MRTTISFWAVLALAINLSTAQSIKDLYQQEDYQSLITFADSSDHLSGEELYCIGYAFFQLANDARAIEMYDKAIKNGLDDDYIYFYKALSHRYSKQPKEAIKNFRLAVDRNPNGQMNHSELGNSFYIQEQYDSALVYFSKARSLPYEYGDPYIKLPNIYHIQENFEKALEEYRISASLINKEDPAYIDLLKEIGLLEYTVFKNYDQSIIAYEEVIRLNEKDYDVYPKLIKAYYAKEVFEKAEPFFARLKTAYEKGELPEDLQEYGNVPVAEFEWNGQNVFVVKYFKTPEETLDLTYKAYLISADGNAIERILMTEKTIQFGEDDPDHLLCERGKDGGHYTYPYGWRDEEMTYTAVKKGIILVLNGELSPAASSNVSAPEPKPEKKSKKKKKKKKKN